METELVAIEAEVSDARARQVVLVNELDRAQAPQCDGSRSMVEWVQSHLDIDTDTARHLLFAARRITRHRYLSNRLADSRCTFPRAVATLKYAESGASYDDVIDSFDRDLAGVARLTARRRYVTRGDEHKTFTDRFFAMQPTLDESSYRLWGQLPGVMGKTLETAVFERADNLRHIASDLPTSRGQRQADALVAMAHDSLDATRTNNGGTDADSDGLGSSSPHVTVFVDATQTDPATTGAEVAFGPRVGPQTLDELLCSGRVQIVGLDNGTPVVTSRATRAIPRAVRHSVLHRDGGCTIDGCTSRYRLEPHHIERWADGGNHSIGNLTTVCWYHHHIAIHGDGYYIDPESPPQRRRLTRNSQQSGADPP
jgi:hypothetical protein